MSRAKRISIVAIAWAFWLAVSPYPFTTYITECAANGTNCTFVNIHEWSWFGGYHIFIEHIFFFDSIDHLYLGFTYPGVAAYLGIALLLAITSFILIVRVRKFYEKTYR